MSENEGKIYTNLDYVLSKCQVYELLDIRAIYPGVERPAAVPRNNIDAFSSDESIFKAITPGKLQARNREI
jgi:hypothetical protein